jgi:hypothetical protein
MRTQQGYAKNLMHFCLVMTTPTFSHVIQKIEQASGLYHRLVLLAAPSGSGKTAVLQEIEQQLNVPLINVNLEVCRRMLELTARQRALNVASLLEDILREADNEVILLDNIEILFEVSLRQDPLRLLQGLSRNRTIVAAWNGNLEKNIFTYASPDHQEYRRYPTDGLMFAEIKQIT